MNNDWRFPSIFGIICGRFSANGIDKGRYLMYNKTTNYTF